VQPDLDMFPDGRSPAPKPMTSRGRAFVRLFTELQKLQRARLGVTLDELARATGVSSRTIRRDLEVLQEAGVAPVDEPVDANKAHGTKQWRVFSRREVA
jgi:transcription initiation factor IIE alpha subunit